VETSSCLAVPPCFETPGIKWARRTITQFRIWHFNRSWNTLYKPGSVALSYNSMSSSSTIRETPGIKLGASHCHANFVSGTSIVHETPCIKPGSVALSCNSMSRSSTIRETPGIKLGASHCHENFVSGTSIVHETPCIKRNASHCHAFSCLAVPPFMKHPV